VFASYGEDLVVMWAFYNYPEAISFEMAANRLLNYKIEIYTSGEWWALVGSLIQKP
jgi:hypothetical protein